MDIDLDLQAASVAEVVEAVKRAIRDFKLCPNRVWAIARSLPQKELNLPQLIPSTEKSKNITGHEGHDQCTFDFCEISHRDFTSLAQRHELPSCADEPCKRLQFSMATLDRAANDGNPTAWSLDGGFMNERPQRVMAISHVWSDGTGAGAWPKGEVNSCLYSFFREIAQQFQCEGIWWDTICIPGGKSARNKAINEIQNNYEDARITLVHDCFLRNWEWIDAETACFAIVMSPWFSRGWTSLELAKSHKVKVVFKGPRGPIIKDLDEDILAKDSNASKCHKIATKAIANLRKAGIAEINDLLTVLGPRYTSWPRDIATISGLLTGVTIPYNAFQQDIYQKILIKIARVSHGHLFHNSTTMAKGFSWCSTSLLNMPIASSTKSLCIKENGDIIGAWKVFGLDGAHEAKYNWKDTHPLIKANLDLALMDNDRHVFLFEPDASLIGRALLVKVMAKKDATSNEQIIAIEESLANFCCQFVGPIYFHPPLREQDVEGWMEMEIRIGDTEGMVEIDQKAWEYMKEARRLAQSIHLDDSKIKISGREKEIQRFDPNLQAPIDKIEYAKAQEENKLREEKELMETWGWGSKMKMKTNSIVTRNDNIEKLEEEKGEEQKGEEQEREEKEWMETWGSWGMLKKKKKKKEKKTNSIAAENGDRKSQEEDKGGEEKGKEEKDEEDNREEEKGEDDWAAAPRKKKKKKIPMVAWNGDTEIQEEKNEKEEEVIERGWGGGWIGGSTFATPMKKERKPTAVWNGDEEKEKKIEGTEISMPAKKKKRERKHNFTLLSAARNGDEADVQRILDEGADPNIQDEHTWTALHCATWRNHVQVVQKLIESADLSLQDGFGQQALHLAAERGNEEIFRRLLKQGVSIIQCNNDGQTVLHCAAWSGSETIVRLLMELLDNVDGQDNDGRTALHVAAVVEHSKIVMLLLNKANINAQDSMKRTALHIAVQNKDDEVLKQLIDKSDHDMQDKDGRTALHLAAKRGHFSVIQLLMEKANCNVQDSDDKTALHIAAERGYSPAVKLLTEKFDLNDRDMNEIRLAHSKTKLNIQDSNGRTALHLAAYNDYIEVVELLLERGADANVEDFEKRTALHLATEKGYISIVKKLLEKAKLDNKDCNGRTALHVALYNDNMVVVKFLLDKGANVNVKDYMGKTALHLAAKKGYTSIITQLLEKAKTDIQDCKDKTALHVATYNHHVEIVELLLEKGADVDMKDYKGQTALHLAAKKGYSQLVRLLIGKANLDIQDSKNQTALHIAGCYEHIEILQLLVEKGADVMVKISDGKTSLDYAIERRSEKVVQLLTEVGGVATEGEAKLHQAVRSMDLDMAKLLLESEMNTEAKDENGMTILHIATMATHEAMVRLVVEKGADVNAKHNNGETALHKAVDSRFNAVIQLLIEKGANIDAQDIHGLTALHKAAITNNKSAMRLLRKLGADSTLKDIKGNTAQFYKVGVFPFMLSTLIIFGPILVLYYWILASNLGSVLYWASVLSEFYILCWPYITYFVPQLLNLVFFLFLLCWATI